MVPTTKPIANFHRQVIAHVGRTIKYGPGLPSRPIFFTPYVHKLGMKSFVGHHITQLKLYTLLLLIFNSKRCRQCNREKNQAEYIPLNKISAFPKCPNSWVCRK